MSIDWEEVQKARHHLSREQGTVVKDWGGKLAVALVYPNSYFLGMSNLGVHALYRLLNNDTNVVCERLFWENTPLDVLPISIETQKPLTDFAVIAFSVSYELDYFNIVQILKASGIPLYAKDRDETMPLIIAGGPCVMANPLPIAHFFDVLCNGEAEVIIPAILPTISGHTSDRRADLLSALAAIPGIYVHQQPPSKPVMRQSTKNLDAFPITTAIVSPDTELGDMYLFEVELGCSWHCRFCLACYIFFPMRVRSMENLLALAQE